MTNNDIQNWSALMWKKHITQTNKGIDLHQKINKYCVCDPPTPQFTDRKVEEKQRKQIFIISLEVLDMQWWWPV